MRVILFVCGHVTKRKVAYDDEERCPECGKWQMIDSYWREQWHANCGRCSYHSKHGYSREKADAAAARHLAYKGHNVKPRFYADAPAYVMKALPKLPPVQTETLPPF